MWSAALALGLAVASGAAYAQNSQETVPPLIPGLENFSLPSRDRLRRDRESAQQPAPPTQPAPVPSTAPSTVPSTVPSTTRSPAPVAAPPPDVRAARPAQAARPGAVPVAPPAPRETSPLDTPVVSAEPQAAPLPEPDAPTSSAPALPEAAPPIALPTATGTVKQGASPTYWLLAAGAALLAGAAGWLLLGRRRAIAGGPRANVEVGAELVPEPLKRATPPPVPVRVAAPAVPVAPIAPPPVPPRPWIETVFTPRRAGTNLTSAAVDYEIVLRNIGEVAARGVIVDIRLLTASNAQEAQLAALFAAPVDRPAVASFDLAPGGQIELSGMAMLPRDSVNAMTAAGRALFVPVLAVNILYRWGGGESGQTATAHVIGIERGAGAKLAPFWLDTGPRMFDTVAARVHDLGVMR